MSNRKYILLKDLPGMKAGAEFTGTKNGWIVGGDYTFPQDQHDFSEWFEEIKEPEARIEVGMVKPIGSNSDGLWYKFNLPYSSFDYNEIPQEKLPAIARAIEAVVNGRGVVRANFNDGVFVATGEEAEVLRNHPRCAEFFEWTDELVKEFTWKLVGKFSSPLHINMVINEMSEFKRKSGEQSKQGGGL